MFCNRNLYGNGFENKLITTIALYLELVIYSYLKRTNILTYIGVLMECVNILIYLSSLIEYALFFLIVLEFQNQESTLEYHKRIRKVKT